MNRPGTQSAQQKR